MYKIRNQSFNFCMFYPPKPYFFFHEKQIRFLFSTWKWVFLSYFFFIFNHNQSHWKLQRQGHKIISYLHHLGKVSLKFDDKNMPHPFLTFEAITEWLKSNQLNSTTPVQKPQINSGYQACIQKIKFILIKK